MSWTISVLEEEMYVGVLTLIQAQVQ